jgi:phage terminase large subunit-like protein
MEKRICQRIALIANTEQEALSVMLTGPSGLLTISPPYHRPTYIDCRKELIWPWGSRATIYTDTAPEKLRGSQFDGAWIDELAKFRHAQETWDQLMFGLRLGPHPRVVITTTPRPILLLKNLMKDKSTVVTQGNTYENRTNLSPIFLNQILKTYEGSPLGQQEIYAQILEEIEGAFWTRSMISHRVPTVV